MFIVYAVKKREEKCKARSIVYAVKKQQEKCKESSIVYAVKKQEEKCKARSIVYAVKKQQEKCKESSIVYAVKQQEEKCKARSIVNAVQKREERFWHILRRDDEKDEILKITKQMARTNQVVLMRSLSGMIMVSLILVTAQSSCTFVDLENAFHRVPQDIVWWAMHNAVKSGL